MREQTINMLELAAGVTLFIGACLYAVNMQAILDAGITAGGKLTQEQHAGVTTVEMMNEDRKLTYKGSEVLYTLREVETSVYDMSVDGIRFSSGSNPEELDLSIIDMKAHYGVQYLRGTDGEVESIQFVKVR